MLGSFGSWPLSVVSELFRSFLRGDIGGPPHTTMELKSEDQRYYYSFIKKTTKFGESNTVKQIFGILWLGNTEGGRLCLSSSVTIVPLERFALRLVVYEGEIWGTERRWASVVRERNGTTVLSDKWTYCVKGAPCVHYELSIVLLQLRRQGGWVLKYTLTLTTLKMSLSMRLN